MVPDRLLAVKEIWASLRRRLVDRIVDYLMEPLPNYERRVRNDLGALLGSVRKADVILIEGDQRVSAIIRYLTQSSWSHSALYIGDELLRRGGEQATWARQHFGERVFETTIPRSTRLAEAPSFGKPIIHYDKYSTGAAAYEVLAQEFLMRAGI